MIASVTHSSRATTDAVVGCIVSIERSPKISPCEGDGGRGEVEVAVVEAVVVVVVVVEAAAAPHLREREEGLVLAVALEDHLDLAGDQEVAVGARRALLDDHGPGREVLRREHFGDPVELLRGAAAAQRIARQVRRIAQ